MLGAAVVGLNVGRLHGLGYLESPHTELKAVCDLVPEKLEWVRQRVLLPLSPEAHARATAGFLVQRTVEQERKAIADSAA